MGRVRGQVRAHASWSTRPMAIGTGLIFASAVWGTLLMIADYVPFPGSVNALAGAFGTGLLHQQRQAHPAHLPFRSR